MEFDFNLPGLGRPKSSRPERVAEAIHQELSILLQQKVRDSRLNGVCVSKVQMSPDLKRAKVYYSLLEGSSASAARKGLERARGFFRSHIAKIMNLRYTPDLVFFFDNQHKKIERLDQLFVQINQEREEKE
ncbi:ribosome-binding factor A [Candidatus Electrothrix marina]|jgi:ribosome-binding factor A|uniref:Ribosome-binding factor A n=1 Tax=Candidatus Electrothrix marina TaxID=1859130 RepID=A0A444J7Q2_9BACT|nr:ribosome-binding factor A [Candidatus Electrothrix marina]RWX50172.1 ribosome-binding factor A [Candidatus Electrothrix marina]